VSLQALNGTAIQEAVYSPPAASEAPNSGLAEYQQEVKKVMRMVNQLNDAGAHINIELPSLVVVGSQSAGKSSLLERVCGIQLPRASGTCTKCPMQVSSGNVLAAVWAVWLWHVCAKRLPPHMLRALVVHVIVTHAHNFTVSRLPGDHIHCSCLVVASLHAMQAGLNCPKINTQTTGIWQLHNPCKVNCYDTMR
jgi:GTPase SAR1 family protein